MNYLGTITSKRQLTIPSKAFERTKLKKGDKVLIQEKDGELRIRKATSLVSELAGSLKKHALKGKGVGETVRLEQEAIEKARLKRYKRKLKREGSELLVIKP